MKKLITLLFLAFFAADRLSAQVIAAAGTNNYTIASYPGNFTAYYDGFTVLFRVTNANTTAATMAISPGAAKSIVNTAGNPLVAGDIAANQVVMMVYDLTNNRFQMISASGNAGGGITGGGTASYLSRWATASTLGNSVVFEDGSGNVGVGTTTPTTKMEVVGNTGLRVTRASNLDQILTLTGGDGSGYASVSAAYHLILNTDLGGNILFQSSGSTKAIVLANGNVGIATTAPNTALDMLGAFSMREMAAPALSPSDQGRIYFDQTANKFKVSEHGGGYVDMVPVSGLTGTGTSNTVAKFTGASVLADSRIFDDGAVINLKNPVSVNTTGASPNASSMLDVSVTGKGILIPRMTSAQIAAMSPLPAAAQGLMVYQTDGAQGFYYNTSVTTTPAWLQISYGGPGWSLAGNSGTTAGTHFIGTTDGNALDIRTNNNIAFRITQGTPPNGGTGGRLIAYYDGSNASPIYSFNGSPGTGMYLSGINQIGFSTNTVERFKITSGGQLLSTKAPSAATPDYAFSTSGGTGMYNNAANQLNFATNGTERIRIDAAGNVAIGSVAPASLLHVAGDAQLGTVSATTGKLILYNSGSAFATMLRAGTATAAVTYVLPTGDGASGNVLSTNGAGTLSWAVDGGGITGGTINRIPIFTSPTTLGNSSLYEVSANIGIGAAPGGSYKLEVAGLIGSTGINETSDMRYKKNIFTIENALQKVMGLRGVNYDWRTDEFKEKNFTADPQIGLIAQEVEKIIPQVVTTDASGFKAVEYSKLVALLIEAIKEQNKKIDSLTAENQTLKTANEKEMNVLKTDVKSMHDAIDVLLKENVSLKTEKK